MGAVSLALKGGEEIDFLIKMPLNNFIFIEAKVSAMSQPYAIEKFAEVKKVFVNEIPKFYVCHQEGNKLLAHNIPIAMLKEYMLEKQ